MATKHDNIIRAKTNDEKCIHDFDLFGFSNSEELIRNENLIALEYSVCRIDKRFNDGRKKFLNSILKKKRIYLTNYFFLTRECTAKININWLLKKYKSIKYYNLCPEDWKSHCTCNTMDIEPNDSCPIHGVSDYEIHNWCPYCGQFKSKDKPCSRCGYGF